MSKKTDIEVKFGFTASETKAKETTRDGMIVLQGDLSQEGTELNLFYDGHPVGGKGGSEKFGSSAGTAMALGGLGSGYSLNGKSDHQVLEDLLLPEYMPYEVDIAASITGPVDNGTVKEVGEKTPEEGDYSKGGSKRFMVAGGTGGTASSGNFSTALSIKSGSVVSKYNTKTTTMGSFTVVNTVTVQDGSEVVKTNKNTSATKYGGTSSSRKLNSASGESTHLVSSGTTGQYYVKGGTKTATHTIHYVYKIYASTEAAGTLTNQALTTDQSMVITVKGGVVKFAIPASYENVEFAMENSLSKITYDTPTGKYIGGSIFDQANFAITTENMILGDGTTTKAYKVYTYATGVSEGTRFRVQFTPKD